MDPVVATRPDAAGHACPAGLTRRLEPPNVAFETLAASGQSPEPRARTTC
jgi:hypothetical protein